MIVICTRCQAKFRVADDKIGPRGAKVRCSRCQNVFLVHPELGSMPAGAQEGGARISGAGSDPFRASTADNPFASNRVRAGAAPPVPPPLPPGRSPEADPFAGAPGGAPADPFGGAASPDPFGGADSADPFGGAPAPDPFAGGPGATPADPFDGATAHDPFAAPAQGDPFASGTGAFEAPAGPEPAPFAPAADRPLAVTDLSDLGIGAPGAPIPEPPPVPSSLAGDDGLALEDRTTPEPRPIRPVSSAPFDSGDPFSAPPGGDPFAGGGAPDYGAYDLGGPPGDEDLGLATGPQAPAPAREPALPPPPAQPRPAASASPAAPPANAVPAVPEDRVPGPGGGRLKAVAVNAVGLAALLLAAFAILAVWRSEGRIGADALRPGALLGVLRSDAGTGPFAARDVTSGLYERDRAPPVLFVRGEVVAKGPEAVPGVDVAVEIVRDGSVVARGVARAGAVPTPEELHGARDSGLLAEAVSAASARAPAPVRPGDAVPFLVVIEDPPPALRGASLRIDFRPRPEAADPAAPPAGAPPGAATGGEGR